MQEKIIIAIGVLIAAFFSFLGWWMENGPDRKKESEENNHRQDPGLSGYEQGQPLILFP